MSNDFPNLIMRASAGTGKTFQLTNRYLGLLVNNAQPSRILASTFTRKAAGEILDRIVERLSDASLCSREASQLSTHIGVHDGWGSTEARSMLLRFLTQLHQVRISTLDAFFASLARSFSLEMGLTPRWNVIDELADAALKDEAIESVLSDDKAEQMLHLLAKGDAQRSVSQLVRDTVNQLYGVYRTTSVDAWHVVKPRALPDPKVVESACERLAMATFEKKALNTGVEADLQRFSTQQWEKFLETGITKAILHDNPKYRGALIPSELLADYQPLLDHAGGILINQLVSHTEGTFKLLQAFDDSYQRLKRQHAAFRFEDVTQAVAASVLDNDYAQFAFRTGDDLNHLLLDEFQDTSPDQWMVIRRFAERTTESTADRSFFCVGDIKQAIYGWRGGEAEIFETVSEQLKQIQHAEPLNHSRRSSPVIMETVNQIFTGLSRHDNLEGLAAPVQAWCHRYEHHTAESKAAGYVRLQVADDSEDVLKVAVDEIAELHRKVPHATIGVLTRKNATVNRIIYLLGRSGILASEEGGNPLTDSAAVNVVLSLIQWIDHPSDSAALFHVAHSPLAARWSIPNDSDGIHQFLASEKSAELSDRLRRQLLVDGYDQLCTLCMELLQHHCTDREKLRLSQLVDLASQWNPRSTLRPSEFVDFVKLTRVAEPSSAAVRVMTVHQSKGLEFDMVVLPELDGDLTGQTPSVVTHRPGPGEMPDGVIRYANKNVRRILPSAVQNWFAQTQARTVSESLCVLYVALTRARQALLMVIPPNEKEKSLPKKFQGLLRAALCDGQPAVAGQTLYENGDPNWFESLQEQQNRDEQVIQKELFDTSDDKDASEDQWLDRFPIRDKAKGQNRAAELVSPSSLEGGQRSALSLAIRSNSQGGLQFGTAIHSLFERVTWCDEGLPSDSELRSALKEIPFRKTAETRDLNRESWESDLIDYFQRSVSTEVVKDVLSKPHLRVGNVPDVVEGLDQNHLSSRVQNERRFAVRVDDQIIQGSIDRYVEYFVGGVRTAVEIIDFKTDAVDSDAAWESDRVNFYRPQLLAYQRAVSTWTGLAPEHIFVHLVFVDPNAPRVVQILN